MPWVLDLGDHCEIAGTSVTPLAQLAATSTVLDHASEQGGVFCAATHYWEFDAPSEHPGDPSVSDHLLALIDRATTTLLIGAVVWAYLGIIFEFLTETVAWERWEGTIEYTFMAPLSRAMHLGGSGVFAVLYGLVRAILLFVVVAAFFGLAFDDANFVAALVILIVASISFFGIGMMTAVLPLISPEKGAQLGFVAQGMLLVVSGVYYPVEVLPDWMQWLSTISPATYALEGIRAAILDGASLGSLWHDIWPLLIIGAACIPLGLWIFNRGEIYAKRRGKLKRSG